LNQLNLISIFQKNIIQRPVHSVGRPVLGLFLAQQRSNSRSRVTGRDDSFDYDVPRCVNNLHNSIQ